MNVQNAAYWINANKLSSCRETFSSHSYMYNNWCYYLGDIFLLCLCNRSCEVLMYFKLMDIRRWDLILLSVLCWNYDFLIKCTLQIRCIRKMLKSFQGIKSSAVSFWKRTSPTIFYSQLASNLNTCYFWLLKLKSCFFGEFFYFVKITFGIIF